MLSVHKNTVCFGPFDLLRACPIKDLTVLTTFMRHCLIQVFVTYTLKNSAQLVKLSGCVRHSCHGRIIFAFQKAFVKARLRQLLRNSLYNFAFISEACYIF